MDPSSPEKAIRPKDHSSPTQGIAAFGERLQKIKACLTWHHASLALIVSFVVLIPFRRAEIPMALMALIGLGLMIKHRKTLWQRPEVKLFSLIFAALWVPIAVSLIGAVNFEKTLTVAIAFLRFYPAAIFMILTLAVPGAAEKLLRLCAWVLLVWVLDALLQVVTGHNILGFPMPGGRVNSFFGTGIHFGMFMATLSPLLLIHAHRHWPQLLQLLILLATATVIFLSQTRGGWVSLVVVLAGFTAWLIWRHGIKFFPRLILCAVLLTVTLVGLLHYSQTFSSRVDRTMLFFSGDAELMDVALSKRLPIWDTAVKMIKANPINGVGARNFRYAYDNYADPDDFWAGENVTAAHSHQLLLEVGSETGLIGLAGMLAAITLLLRTWLKADHDRRLAMLPYALALLTVFFPINSHYAMYSTAWSSPYFWLIALFCATSGQAIRPGSRG